MNRESSANQCIDMKSSQRAVRPVDRTTSRPPALVQKKTHGIFFELFPWFLLGESLSSGCIQVSFLETDQAFEEGFRSNRRVMVTDRLAWTLNQLAQKKMLPSSRSLRWGA